MLTAMTKAKVAVFVMIAMVMTTFLAVRYVGLDRLFGGYEVTVDLPAAGGLFKNSEVTYRGVPVGRVTSLTATRTGAAAVVRIANDAPPMPARVRARVVDRSAIGEQYLDLSGGAVGTDRLGDGDHLTVAAADLPPALDGLLRSSRDFVKSVPSDDLSVLIDETYDFTQGNGVHLARLLKTSSDFAKTANDNFLVTASLIDNSGKVLATQQAVAGSFQSFSADLKTLAHAFSDQEDDWRAMIQNTPAAAREVDTLFATVGQPLGELMANMVSTAEVFGTNAAGVRETMIKLPEGISITYGVIGSKGMRSGATLSFFDPLPCVKGYEKTPMRPGLDTSPGKPFNTKAGCTAPTVRGPQSKIKGEKAAHQAATRARVGSADKLSDLLGDPR